MPRTKTISASLGAFILLLGGAAVLGFSHAADTSASPASKTIATLGAGNADGSVKLVFMLKRNPKLSREEFLKYYEGHHRLLGEKYVPNATRYVRRFLDPLPGPFSESEQQFDVLTELWFANNIEMEKAMKHLSEPRIHAEIVADEEKLFDRPASRMYMVTERDSKVRTALQAVK